ncbi:transposase domain-containing protein [Streptomyces sp. NRRL F-2664]|uniref:transposase domain-containing protein n=1 Tax=Streptomyces sp. NRRL F-2664 TaxID=1463842 RepID=UPI0018FE7F3A
MSFIAPEAPLSGKCVITQEAVVDDGLFAPGHLGELTRIVPFEMADAVLAETGAGQRRLRKLPARLPADGRHPVRGLGYPAIWRKLTAGLEALPIPTATGTALWDARTRLGAGDRCGTCSICFVDQRLRSGRAVPAGGEC